LMCAFRPERRSPIPTWRLLKIQLLNIGNSNKAGGYGETASRPHYENKFQFAVKITEIN
jgi:hypothetical protein